MTSNNDDEVEGFNDREAGRIEEKVDYLISRVNERAEEEKKLREEFRTFIKDEYRETKERVQSHSSQFTVIKTALGAAWTATLAMAMKILGFFT